MNPKYESIAKIAHHEPRNHPRMSRYDRAAQFAPFAALTGYAESINETARTTEQKRSLDESEKEILSSRLNYLFSHRDEKTEVTFVYFVKDARKAGGSYQSKVGILVKKDDTDRVIQLEDKTRISIDDIMEIRGDIFDTLD